MTKIRTKEGNLYIRGFPEDLLKRFKAHCALKGTPMKKLVAELMEKEIDSVKPSRRATAV